MFRKRFGEVNPLKKYEKPYKGNAELILKCGKCERYNTITRLDADYECACGNKIVEYNHYRTNIKCKTLELKH